MLRTSALLILVQLFVFCGYSQSNNIARIVDLPRTKVDRLDPKANENTIVLKSNFSKEYISDLANTISGDIEKVYYIYTAFAQSPSFSQKSLDSKRITELGALFPEVLSNRFIEWKLIAQTDCSSAAEGPSFFHGFVLVTREASNEVSRNEEIKRLEQFFKDPTTWFTASDADEIQSTLSREFQQEKETENTEATFPEGNFALFQYFRENTKGGGQLALNRDDLWVDIDFAVDKSGKVGIPSFHEDYADYIQEEVLRLIKEMPDWTPELKDGIAVDSKVNLQLRMCFSPIVRGMYQRDGKKPSFKQSEVANFQDSQVRPNSEVESRVARIEKSSIYRGMSQVVPREKVAVVMDVTSSMSDHVASLNWWVINSPDSLNIVHYTFFNDGDNAPDNKKKAGKVGGIYHGKALRDLTATLMDAMRNGNGGDLPENDFEAVLEAQTNAPNAQAILLMVDNFSGVRDIFLMDQIQKPVHVIVSGEVTAVREVYLNIAKATGGDLIVNGERISLANVVAGGQIMISETRYIYDGDSFKIL